jgi:hypothetical protein
MNDSYETDQFAIWNDPAFVRDISLGRFGARSRVNLQVSYLTCCREY